MNRSHMLVVVFFFLCFLFFFLAFFVRAAPGSCRCSSQLATPLAPLEPHPVGEASSGSSQRASSTHQPGACSQPRTA
jgi:hypothetical protein